MPILPCGAVQAPIQTPDEAAIKTVIESMTTLADRGEFRSLEQLFASQVLVDYSSLTGSAASVQRPLDLVSGWAALLPGFERTRHGLSDLTVRVHGNDAEATATAVADHWIDDRHWQVCGRYDFALARDGRDWIITALRFVLCDEQGGRDTLEAAQAAARANPHPYLYQRQTA